MKLQQLMSIGTILSVHCVFSCLAADQNATSLARHKAESVFENAMDTFYITEPTICNFLWGSRHTLPKNGTGITCVALRRELCLWFPSVWTRPNFPPGLVQYARARSKPHPCMNAMETLDACGTSPIDRPSRDSSDNSYRVKGLNKAIKCEKGRNRSAFFPCRHNASLL